MDLDLDNQTSCEGDCDDTNNKRKKGNPEACDGFDSVRKEGEIRVRYAPLMLLHRQDCDNVTPNDERFDVDGDGLPTCADMFDPISANSE